MARLLMLVVLMVMAVMAGPLVWAGEAPEPSTQPAAAPASRLAAKPAHHCFPSFPKQTFKRRTKAPNVAQRSTNREGTR